MIKILKVMSVASLIMGAACASQAADISGIFGHTVIWRSILPVDGELISTLVYHEDGTITATQGDRTVTATWKVKGDQHCVTVPEADGRTPEICSPAAAMDGAKPGSKWDFPIQDDLGVITVKVTVSAGP
jgi:hypothetical protein